MLKYVVMHYSCWKRGCRRYDKELFKRPFVHQNDVMHLRNSLTNTFDSCIDLFLSGIKSVYYLLLCKCPSLSYTQKSCLKRLAVNNWCFWHLHHAYSKRGFGLRVSEFQLGWGQNDSLFLVHFLTNISVLTDNCLPIFSFVIKETRMALSLNILLCSKLILFAAFLLMPLPLIRIHF